MNSSPIKKQRTSCNIDLDRNVIVPNEPFKAPIAGILARYSGAPLSTLTPIRDPASMNSSMSSIGCPAQSCFDMISTPEKLSKNS